MILEIRGRKKSSGYFGNYQMDYVTELDRYVENLLIVYMFDAKIHCFFFLFIWLMREDSKKKKGRDA